MAEHNQIIPPEVWPNIQDEAPWDSLPIKVHKRFQQDSEIFFSKWTNPDQLTSVQPSSMHQTEEWPSLAIGRPFHNLGLTNQYPPHIAEGLKIRQQLFKSISPQDQPSSSGPRTSVSDMNLSLSVSDSQLSPLHLGPPGHYYEDSQDPYADQTNQTYQSTQWWDLVLQLFAI